MKLRDTFVLVGAKIRTHRKRTIVTVMTASILFGVVIAVLMIVSGLEQSVFEMERRFAGDDEVYKVAYIDRPWLNEIDVGAGDIGNGEKVIGEADGGIGGDEEAAGAEEAGMAAEGEGAEDEGVRAEDEEATGEGAEDEAMTGGVGTMKETTTEEAEAASEVIAEGKVADYVRPFGAEIIARVDTYTLANDLYIDGYNATAGELGDSIDVVSGVGQQMSLGKRVMVMRGSDYMRRFVQTSGEAEGDVIQIVTSVTVAALLNGIGQPSYHAKDPAVAMRDFLRRSNEAALGQRFHARTTVDGEEREVDFKIVGLLPPAATSTINPNTVNLLAQNVQSLLSNAAVGDYSFYIVNPESSAFRSLYTKTTEERVTIFLVMGGSEAELIEQIQATREESIVASKFLDTRYELRVHFGILNRALTPFVIAFTIISAIIMVGIFSRVADDERFSISLYRAIGATNGDILRIFILYVLLLCLMIMACATLIGLALAGVVTLTNTELLSANLAGLCNLPEMKNLIFIGFDLRIGLVFVAILAIGGLSTILTLDKLLPRDIVKNLKVN